MDSSSSSLATSLACTFCSRGVSLALKSAAAAAKAFARRLSSAARSSSSVRGGPKNQAAPLWSAFLDMGSNPRSKPSPVLRSEEVDDDEAFVLLLADTLVLFDLGPVAPLA